MLGVDEADRAHDRRMQDPVHVWRLHEHLISHFIHTGEKRDLALFACGAVHPEDPEGYLQSRVAAHEADLASRRAMNTGHCIVQRQGPLPEASTQVREAPAPAMPTREQYIVSEEYESHRAENIGKSDLYRTLTPASASSHRSRPVAASINRAHRATRPSY